MKKKLLFVFLFASILLLTGCGEKSSISTSTFWSTMENMGFVVSDEKDEREEYSYMTAVVVAADSEHVINYYDEENEYENEEERPIIKKEYDPNYQIEFYVFDTESNAIGFYNNNKAIFETQKVSTTGVSEEAKKNYARYLLDTGEKYMCVSRVGNTVIYFNVVEEFKTTANNVLTKFGY